MSHRSEKTLALGWVPLSILLITLAAYGLFFLHLGTPFYRDWYYFNALSLVVRSSILNYGVFPGHNPWICGGLDILTNPQNRVFSPFLVTDLLMSPQAANLFVLVLYTFFGLCSAFALLRALGQSKSVALTIAAIFVCGSWFSLHFAEGHIPYASMQLLPLIVLCGMRLDRLFYRALLLFSLGIMLLDGGIYPFIFSWLLLISMALFKMLPASVFFSRPRSLLKTWGLLGIAFTLLVLPKLAPVLTGVAEKKPVLDFFEMPWPLILKSLFYPFQTLLIPMDSYYPQGYPFPYGFHEFGCYLSLLGIGLIFGAIFRVQGFLRVNIFLIYGFFFWFWVGSGLIPDWNPWNLFQMIPLINIAHVQSRIFILMFVFFVILLARAIDALEFRPLVKNFLLAFLLLEAIVVRNYPMTIAPPVYENPVGHELIQSRTISMTHEMGSTPQHYLQRPDTGSALCYEPSFMPKAIRYTGHPDYRGEAYFIGPSGRQVRLVSYTPGRIKLSYTGGDADRIELNTNALFGWQVVSGQGELFGTSHERLQILPDTRDGEIELAYQFPHRNLLLLSLLIGLGIFGIIFLRSKDI